jgi:hypothetical protein
VAFFAWAMALRKILTLDNLQKMDIIVIEWCFVRKKVRSHQLLRHGEVARELWSSLFQFV